MSGQCLDLLCGSFPAMNRANEEQRNQTGMLTSFVFMVSPMSHLDHAGSRMYCNVTALCWWLCRH